MIISKVVNGGPEVGSRENINLPSITQPPHFKLDIRMVC